MNSQLAVPHCIFFVAPEWEHSNVAPEQARATTIEQAAERAHRTGCDALLMAAPTSGLHPFPDLIDDPDRASDAANTPSTDTCTRLTQWVDHAHARNLKVLIDVDLVYVAALGAFAKRWPDAYRLPAGAQAIDPRLSHHDAARARLVTSGGRMDPALLDDWVKRVRGWLASGVAGIRLRHLSQLPAADVTSLTAQIKSEYPAAVLLGDTPGLAPDGLAALRDAGLDAVFSSLPWWDFKSPWLVEEHDRLERVAPVVVACASIHQDDDLAATRRKLWAAAMTGDSLMVCASTDHGQADALIAEATAWHRAAGPAAQGLRLLTGTALGVTALFRGDGMAFASPRAPGNAARLLVINPTESASTHVDWNALRARLPGSYADISLATAPQSQQVALPETLAAGETLLAWVKRTAPVTATVGAPAQRPPVSHALAAPRIAIEAITPTVDDGRFPLKRTVGEQIRIEADVFMDGHDHIAVQVQWRAADEIGWHEVPMVLLNNDRYVAHFAAHRVGRHEFKVCAWRDAWETYRDELSKKHAAGLNVALEIEEGRRLVHRTRAQLVEGNTAAAALDDIIAMIGQPSDAPPVASRRKTSPSAAIPPMNADHVVRLLSEDTAHAMAHAGHRPFLSESERAYPINVERQAASFASWYEIFPRSQSGTTERHGTFVDVIGRLPAIRAMGFDVLYFPPIHPIGLSNRKGKNNTLNAGADQPGSPYAIGSRDGGHSDVHPELGSLEDFQALVAAAHAHGLEIALDFAIQCSPDHPWLKQHPEWFAWRADGTMRYAENPPKKYEDIVNVDFYSEGAEPSEQAALWEALRDVIVFWCDQGVRTFRVDNPHTKPLPFWEWMIQDVQSQHPDTLFLSEAFTRPKMMYRLAKAGFSQSYTYFTWREQKDEFSSYLLELNDTPARDIFRPNFFVNTPDINPRFLQRSGRPGHLIRMALATTTSGLWGVYSGFELCEATPMPGKEEYLDSEKYEVRAWDWNRPGNIVAEITAMNLLRRQNPALQSHLGLTLHTIYNDQILLFTKATPERDNVILVAINMDPFNTQSGGFELPLWQFGLPDDAALHVSDLVAGNSVVWHGKHQSVTLSPDLPYAVWRLDGPA
ncbi:MAG: alpha-1,4-glucan--maltose-1-phosphate maltosyltransferase [Comamonadaceae bacterium]|nr:MAG: alpha-1,4-glucan--maltose-1-phosphate maltosyltransferase [Comamonadaceae bacterium]